MSCKPTDLWEVKLGLASTGHVVFEDQLSEKEMNRLIDAFQQSLEAKEDMDVTVRTSCITMKDVVMKGAMASGKEVERTFKKRLIIPYSVIKGCIVITILVEEQIKEG